MKIRRARTLYVLVTAALLIGGASMLAAADDGPPGGIKIPPIPAPSPIMKVVPDPPIFVPSGGPYVGEQAALTSAAKIARSPISRQDVRLMRYRDVVAFTGNRTFTIDLDREVYFVVTSATFVGRHGEPICPSYTAVIDATSGVGLSVSCGDAAWPTRLPSAFHR